MQNFVHAKTVHAKIVVRSGGIYIIVMRVLVDIIVVSVYWYTIVLRVYIIILCSIYLS